MKKPKLIRSALAVGMAFTLASAPVSTMAQEVYETELSDDASELLEDTLEAASLDGLKAAAYDLDYSAEFGDGLYNLYSDQGLDLSWLKNADVSGKIVPTDTGADMTYTAALNGTELLHVLISADMKSGMLYLSIPELFKDPAAVDLQKIAKVLSSAASGEQQGSSSEDAMTNMIMEIVTGMVAEIATQAKDFITSIPLETWSSELMTYSAPIMNYLATSVDTATLTVGDLEAEVNVQTYSISSENMGSMISEYLTLLSQDQILEALLTSDFVDSALSLASMFGGVSSEITGESILAQVRSALENAANADFSDIPGVSVSIYQDNSGKSGGFSFDLEAGGEIMNLCALKVVTSGSENAIEFAPSPVFLSMCGIDPSNSLEIKAGGRIENDLLNERVDVFVNGSNACTITLENFDLNSMNTGKPVGKITIEAAGMVLELTYGVKEDGTSTLEYLVNGEVFYNIEYYAGASEDTSIETIDKAAAVPITSLEELGEYLGTFSADTFMNLLTEAGVPLNGSSAGQTAETTVAA